MKCPLKYTLVEAIEEKRTWADEDCIRERCAWWEPKIGKCAVLRMWIALQDIHEVLHDIHKKMPSPEFFKK